MKNKRVKKLPAHLRGITIAETVIAIAVISIVSVAVTTTALISANVENKTIVSLEAANSAENAIECFRFSDSEENFANTLKKTADYKKKSNGVYIMETDDYKVTIIVDYSDISAPSFEYNAVDKNGDTIQSFTYPYKIEAGGGSE
ncbi:MAG: type II secretion system protein [Oscillospiraceae bacterium]|nr:type II secretion system protein [Oscillospiraceae bacterium]